MDVDLIVRSLPPLWEGLQNTLFVVGCSALIGAAIGLVVGLAMLSAKAWLRHMAGVYSALFRRTPILVQLFFVYYGLAQFALVRESWVWWLIKDPIPCAITVFSLNHGGYLAPILVGAVADVGKGQWEGARSLSLSRSETFALVIFPQVRRLALPAYLNELIFLLKGSALLSAIAAADLVSVARRISSANFAPIEMFSVTAATYAIIVLVIMAFASRAQKRAMRTG